MLLLCLQFFSHYQSQLPAALIFRFNSPQKVNCQDLKSILKSFLYIKKLIFDKIMRYFTYFFKN